MVKQFNLDFLQEKWNLQDQTQVLNHIIESLLQTGHVKCIWSSRDYHYPKKIHFHVLLNLTMGLMLMEFEKEKEDHFSMLQDKGKLSKIILKFAEQFRRNIPKQHQWRIVHDYPYGLCILLDDLTVVYINIYEVLQTATHQNLVGYRVYGETPFLLQEGSEDQSSFKSPLEDLPNQGVKKVFLWKFHLELVWYIQNYKSNQNVLVLMKHAVELSRIVSNITYIANIKDLMETGEIDLIKEYQPVNEHLEKLDTYFFVKFLISRLIKELEEHGYDSKRKFPKEIHEMVLQDFYKLEG